MFARGAPSGVGEPSGCCVWRRVGRSSRCAALRCARRSKAEAEDRWTAVLRHDGSNTNCSRASFPEERQASFGRDWNASSEVFEHFCAWIKVDKRKTKSPLAKTANGARRFDSSPKAGPTASSPKGETSLQPLAKYFALKEVDASAEVVIGAGSKNGHGYGHSCWNKRYS